MGPKWYVIGKDERLVREMGASMTKRVQRQHNVHMNSLKISTLSETSEYIKMEEFVQGSKRQPSLKIKKEIERANSMAEGEG